MADPINPVESKPAPTVPAEAKEYESALLKAAKADPQVKERLEATRKTLIGNGTLPQDTDDKKTAAYLESNGIKGWDPAQMLRDAVVSGPPKKDATKSQEQAVAEALVKLPSAMFKGGTIYLNTIDGPKVDMESGSQSKAPQGHGSGLSDIIQIASRTSPASSKGGPTPGGR